MAAELAPTAIDNTAPSITMERRTFTRNRQEKGAQQAMESDSQPQHQGNLWNSFVEAVRFLTIIPVPFAPATGGSSFARSLGLFPLVGLLIGALLVFTGLIAQRFWPSSVAAVAVVVAWGMLTSGLHLDGLSDTFDGVMSWRPRERKLEIMRDSRIGVMGALALVAILGLKVALLVDVSGRAPALLLAPVLGRWAMCYGLCRYPSARPDGLGAMAQAQRRSATLPVATILAAVAVLLVGGARGVIAFAVVWLVVVTLSRWWVRELGGLTGDTYGALCESAEVVALAALTARA